MKKALIVEGTATCQPLPCSMQIFGLPACRQIGQNTGLPWGEKYHVFRDTKNFKKSLPRPPTVYQT